MTTPIPSTVLETLKQRLGPGGWLDDPAECERYTRDWYGKIRGSTPLVVRPANVTGVQEVVRLCHEQGVALVPQGGHTGMVGGATPGTDSGSVVLSLERLRSIRAVDPANFTLVAEAGVVLAEIQQTALDHDRYFPLSLGAEGSCTIGGNVSTNAGGMTTLRYGNTRDLLLGVEVVLPDGRLWEGLNLLRKNTAGYDLKHLFIGAEGTLGIVTACALKLFPRPRQRDTAFLAVPSPQAALDLLALARERSGDMVSRLELMARPVLELVLRQLADKRDPLEAVSPWYVLMELETSSTVIQLRPLLEAVLDDAMARGWVTDGVVAESLDQARALWSLREEIPQATAAEGGGVSNDISIPLSAIPSFIERTTPALEAAFPGCRVIPYGHIGDGNLHYNVLPPLDQPRAGFLARAEAVRDVIYEFTLAEGGSIAAEHGIGSAKRARLPQVRGALDLELMRGLKALLDPAGLLNPGKVL